MPDALPYRLACLCDLRDARGRILLLRRKRHPNMGLYSPIGGKLDVESGESPTRCAQREIQEEAGLEIPLERIHLHGMVSERAYEGRGHWLIFFFRVLGAVELEEREIEEGWLEWHDPAEIHRLPRPDTDREIIWPLILRHERSGPGGRPGFFAVHIDCSNGRLEWSVEQEHHAAVQGDG